VAEASAVAELLWLETLQLVAGRTAHELKGALNGVSVNLEVVRGRAAHPELPASAVARFAGSAATQLDQVIEMNEALLALARRPREPVDVAATLRHLGALLVPGAVAGGTAVSVDASADLGSVEAAAPAPLLRALLGRLLLGVIEAGGGAVNLRAADGAVVVEAVASRRAVALGEPLLAAAAGAGVRASTEGLVFTLTFPGAAAPAPRATATHGTA
jgi:hypothetical protein